MGSVKVSSKKIKSSASRIWLPCKFNHEVPTRDGLEIVKLVQKLVKSSNSRNSKKISLGRRLQKHSMFSEEFLFSNADADADAELRDDIELNPRGTISLNEVYDADDVSKVKAVSYSSPNKHKTTWLYIIDLDFKFVEIRRRGVHLNVDDGDAGEFIWVQAFPNVTDAWMKSVEDDEKGERKQREWTMPTRNIDSYYYLELSDFLEALRLAVNRTTADDEDVKMDVATIRALERFQNVLPLVDDPETVKFVKKLPKLHAISELVAKSIRMRTPD